MKLLKSAPKVNTESYVTVKCASKYSCACNAVKYNYLFEMISSERWGDFVSRLLANSVYTLSPLKQSFRHKIGLWAIRCQCLQTGATDVLNSCTLRYEKIIVSTSFGSIIIEGSPVNLSFIECVMYFGVCCWRVNVSTLVESLPATSSVGIFL
jgi:hypothetical protein